jgi:L-asparaginase
MSIAVLVTGGTFDKEYNELDGTLSFREPHVGQMLAQGRCRLPVRIQVVMMKDSLEMTGEDRTRILEACTACPEARIVITHGTDTMEDTAQFLAGRVGDKTVVLTGAMVPYTFGSSDGLFNLGSALSFAQVLSPGVYVAMNGHYFRAGEVFKDKTQGIFRARPNGNG